MVLVCPVCESANESRQCSRCDTDLTPLARMVDLSEYYREDGEAHMARGDVESAIDNLKMAAQFDPENAAIQKALAEAVRTKEVRTSALAALQRTHIRRCYAIIWALTSVIVLSACIGTGTFLALRPKIDAPEARLERARQWLSENRLTGEIVTTLNGNLIAVKGEVPTASDFGWVKEGVLRSAGTPADFAQVKVAEPVATAPILYRIRAGDSYWSIARRQYGTPLIWSSISDANQTRSSSGSLVPGTDIVLPVISLYPLRRGRIDR